MALDTESVTVGVDLASSPKKTAACRIRWSGRMAEVETPIVGLTDREIVDFCKGASRIGIDAPFGWPSRFVEALNSYGDSGDWPDTDLDDLRFRRTDLYTRSVTGRAPLSVSTERLAFVAFRAARLLQELAAVGVKTDRGLGDKIVEVYPAAALARWGLQSTGYKGSDRRDARTAMILALRERCVTWLHLPDATSELCIESDDALDALIASLVAKAAEVGAIDPRPNDEPETTSREGWIALPTATGLSSLAAISDR